MSEQTFIALLRGINVGGKNPVPMAGLRTACEERGLQNVRTYIASGNVVFSSHSSATRLENELEAAITKRFGLAIPVVIRTANEWERLAASNPFPDASESHPNLVMLGLAKSKVKVHAEAELQKRAAADEAVAVRDDAIWIHFGSGAGRTKITPAILDRAAGSPVTMRNWRTVLKLLELTST